MLDVQGTSLTPEDRDILQHPWVGGFILFSRNFESPAQLAELTQQIRHASQSDILIAVDHEGGRVQRFRQGFTAIPAMGSLIEKNGGDITRAKQLAEYCGVLMALEVQAVGIDISFAPVLDVNNISEVIGDRGFSDSPDVVTTLASAFIDGMNRVGMLATGKHFPGHGSVQADSHLALPIDKREQAQVLQHDILPFQALMKQDKLAAIMPAHIIFPAFDSQAVGFSPYWLQQVLRQQLQFDGVIFSDDLSMEGATAGGGYVERSEAAQQAGCDMLLLCNNRDAAIKVIDQANLTIKTKSQQRLRRLLSSSEHQLSDLNTMEIWQQARQFLQHIH